MDFKQKMKQRAQDPREEESGHLPVGIPVFHRTAPLTPFYGSVYSKPPRSYSEPGIESEPCLKQKSAPLGTQRNNPRPAA